jgi:hypothetical protein
MINQESIMNRKLGTWARALAAAAMLFPAVLSADVAIYDSLPGDANYVPFTQDATSATRPEGAWIGNTITFDPTAWAANDFLDSVVIAPGTDTGASNFTMYLYSGSDPTTGALLASSTTFVGHSAASATFTFDVVVPQTVTFIISSDNPGVAATCISSQTCAGVQTTSTGPTVGSTPGEVWYGDVNSNVFTGATNSSWAIADGDITNDFAAEFLATTVPEPSAIVLLGSILGILGIGVIGRRRKARS